MFQKSCMNFFQATGNLTYIFPVFVTVFISKIVGDFLNEGLYEIHINILGIPLLPYQPKVELRTGKKQAFKK